MENLLYLSLANAFNLHGSVLNLITPIYKTYTLHFVDEFDFERTPGNTWEKINTLVATETNHKTGFVRPDVGLREIFPIKKPTGKVDSISYFDKDDDTLLDF